MVIHNVLWPTCSVQCTAKKWILQYSLITAKHLLGKREILKAYLHTYEIAKESPKQQSTQCSCVWLQTTLDQTFKPDFFFDAFAVPFSELLDNRATFVGLGLDVSFKVLVCFSFTGLEFSLAVVFRFAGVFAGLAVSSFCFSSKSFVALVPPAECQNSHAEMWEEYMPFLHQQALWFPLQF